MQGIFKKIANLRSQKAVGQVLVACEEVGPSGTNGRNVKWYNHFGKQ